MSFTAPLQGTHDRRHRSAVAGILLIASCLAWTPRSAQGQAGVTDVSRYPSQALPDAPAFTFLAVAPTSVSRPVSPRAFASSLINAIDSSGQVLQGIAIDVTPWTYIPGVSISLDEYQQSRAKYALANMQVSLATVRAGGESGNTNVGIGLRFSPWNRSDPMQDATFTNSLRNATRGCFEAVQQAAIDTLPKRSWPI